MPMFPGKISLPPPQSGRTASRALGLLLVAVLLSIGLGQIPARAAPPIAVDDVGATDEDTPFTTVNVLDNDTDPDPSHVLSVIGMNTTGTIGQVTNNGDGTFYYNPDSRFEYLSVGQTAEDKFVYGVSDGVGGIDTATVTITISGRNDPPVAQDDFSSTDEDTPISVGAPGVLGNDTDPDGSDSLLVTGYDKTSAQGAAVVVNGDGSYSYDPTGATALQALSAADVIVDAFTYTISDGNDGSSTAVVHISVTGINDPPIAVDDTNSTNEDARLLVVVPGVLGNDSDPESDLLSVTRYDAASAQDAAVIVGSNGSYSYDPRNSARLQALPFGVSIVDTFGYTIDDGTGGTAAATVHVTVEGANDAPTAYDDQGQDYTTDEDTPLTTGNVLGNDLDPDQDDDLSVLNFDATGVLGQLAYNGDGTFSYDPNGQFEALGIGAQITETFTYTVSDGQGSTDTATVSIWVQGVNDAPLATNNKFLVQEDATNELLDPLGDDTDVEGDSLTIVSATLPMSGTIAIAEGGAALLYTPDPDFYGYDSLVYTISDGNGGFDTATIDIEVANTNDDPVAQDDPVEILEDSGVNILDVLANDTYLPDPIETLTITSTTPAAYGVVEIAPDGSYLSYTPTANYYGPDTFAYTVIDGNGGSTDAQVAITVLNVNDDPQAVADIVVVDEDSLNVRIDVLLNDTYLPDPVETLTVVATTNGSHGQAAVLGGTRLRYTPDANYYGPDELTYTISDGNGGTATGTVQITVQNVNDDPVAQRDTAEVDEDSGPNRIDVLSNDTYLPDPPETLTIVGYTSVQHGSVIIVEGGAGLTYRPDADYYGTDSFAYYISDGNGGYHSASIDVIVRGINDPPNAEDDSASTEEDTPVTIDVLQNDGDIDGRLVASTVRVTSPPSHGSTTVSSSNGKITYTPSKNWNGKDTFTYKVCDDGSPLPRECSTADVAIAVGSVNDPPISNAGPDQNTPTNTRVTLDGSASTDPDNNLPLVYYWWQTGGPPVSLSDASTATPSFTAPDDPALLTFALRVTDALGQADLVPDETVVTVLNQPPVANAGPDQAFQAESQVTLDGSGSRDPDNDLPLKYLWTQSGGPAVSLKNATTARPSFTAPNERTVLTFALFVSDAFDEPALTADEVVVQINKPYSIYLPVMAHQYVVAPDLVIESITARSNSVQVVIRNQGNGPVKREFWVDLYINPHTAPTAVNQPWYELGNEGLVWGVSGQGLPALTPGGTLTLTNGDRYYYGDYSKVSWPLSAGTRVYGQVDSFDPSTTYGTVHELDEILDRPYNNIYGPIQPTTGAAADVTRLDKAPSPAALGNLPPRR